MKTNIYIRCLAVGILLSFSCNRNVSQERSKINNPDNGYIQEVNTDMYACKIQYQTPEYRADQEIMLNKSSVSKSALVADYDQLQQFLVQVKVTDPQVKLDEFGLMDKFSLVLSDTIPCIDAHAVPYSPGAPYQDILLLFPISERELGKKFTFIMNEFPFSESKHQVDFTINKD